MDQRLEHDLLGQRLVPAEAYYGIHTVRALENFPVSGRKTHPELIRSLAQVKQAAAEANMEAGLLDRRIGAAIAQAAAEVAQGELLDQFPVDALQGGAGTSTNMNMNEVLANRAIELLGGSRGDYGLVHPLNQVNMSQSTNDVYPTALRVAAIKLLQPLSEQLAGLQNALQEKEGEFGGVLKIGRTEMQDAVPLTLGQEFGAWAEAVARDRWRIFKVEERLRQVNLGGTAVGTGLNADRNYGYLVIERLRNLTGLGLARAENMVDITQNADVLVEVSGLLKAAAATQAKVAADLRLLSSGPRSGFREINLPSMAAGSSIMPGKVNPVIPEMVTQVSYRVMAHDLAITLAAQGGQLELNAFLPLICHHLLAAIEELGRGTALFAERCIQGISANAEHCRELLEQSFSLVTALVPHIGYEAATRVAQQAVKEGATVRQTVIALGLMTEEELTRVLSLRELVRPGIAGQQSPGGRSR